MASARSLKTRLIAVAAFWIVAGLVLAGLALSSIFRTHVTAQFHEELFVHLTELQRLAQIDRSGAVLTRHLSDPRYDDFLSGFYWEIQRDNMVLARSPSMQGAMLKTPVDEPKDIDVHTHEIDGPTGRLVVAERAHWITPEGPAVRYIIGTDQRHLDRVFHEFDRTLWSSLAAFAVAMIVAAGLLLVFALRPLDDLRAALGDIRSGSKRKLEGVFPREVQPVVDDLNSLLKSTSDLVQRARTQAGNIAHGLKTPLAILADEADRLKEAGQHRPAETITTQLRKMQTHIDYQIARARAAAAHVTIGNATSLATGLDEVLSALRRLYLAREIAVQCDVDRAIRVACDRQDLNEILANLLDNAMKHTRSRIVISSQAGSSPKLVSVLIDDDGSGLPPEARDLVFNVGERWDSREAGTGLGLAIARDLARLYGGDIVLEDSPLGGLRVELSLPGLPDRQ